MKNIKILAPILVLVIVITAVFAFSPKEKIALITADHIVQPENLEFVPFMDTPNPNDCESTSDRNCAYDVTPLAKSNIPEKSSYSVAEIDTYVSNEWLEENPQSSNGLYNL